MNNLEVMLNNTSKYEIAEENTDLSIYLEKLNLDKNIALAIGEIVNNKMTIQHIRLISETQPNVKVITQNGYEILVVMESYNSKEIEKVLNNQPTFILLGNVIVNKNTIQTVEPII